jgi:hypothetical protein
MGGVIMIAAILVSQVSAARTAAHRVDFPPAQEGAMWSWPLVLVVLGAAASVPAAPTVVLDHSRT